MNETQAQTEARAKRLQNAIHHLLGAGVIISSILMVFGLFLQLLRPGAQPPVVDTLDHLLPDLLTFQPSGFLTLGLLALIATPILRVIGSLFTFLAERDWRYSLITLVVLLIVVASIFIG